VDHDFGPAALHAAQVVIDLLENPQPASKGAELIAAAAEHKLEAVEGARSFLSDLAPYVAQVHDKREVAEAWLRRAEPLCRPETAAEKAQVSRFDTAQALGKYGPGLPTGGVEDVSRTGWILYTVLASFAALNFVGEASLLISHRHQGRWPDLVISGVIMAILTTRARFQFLRWSASRANGSDESYGR
jgi:hypothetical protein